MVFEPLFRHSVTNAAVSVPFETLHRMNGPFRGSTALAAGMTRHALRTRFVAVHRDVYVAKDLEMTAALRARACWLRSRGHGVLAGFSASARHGARWVDGSRPATVIDGNRRREPGLTVWADVVEADEICLIDGMRVTTPLRTAIDLARHHPVDESVPAIDALARATRLRVEDLRGTAPLRGMEGDQASPQRHRPGGSRSGVPQGDVATAADRPRRISTA